MNIPMSDNDLVHVQLNDIVIVIHDPIGGPFANDLQKGRIAIRYLSIFFFFLNCALFSANHLPELSSKMKSSSPSPVK